MVTGCELSAWLFDNFDFCSTFCGNELLCPISWDNYICIHQIAYDMFRIAVDMLETA